MKRSVTWHLQCLANMRSFARNLRTEAKEAIARAERTERDCMVLDAQILRAELKGIKEFDADKFNKKRQLPQSVPEEKK